MKLILIAPSGGGKGSLADLLVKEYGIPNISTGDLFRKNIAEKTELGIKAEGFVKSGAWVPDEVTIGMLMDRIKDADCKNGYIIDGFPRTLGQAHALAEKVQVDTVIELDVPDNIVFSRLAGRWICKKCGHIWNTRYPDFDAEKCGKCTGEIYQREDDKQETIARRLQQYRDQNKEILDFYRSQGKLFTIKIKAEDMPQDTFEKVKNFLDN